MNYWLFFTALLLFNSDFLSAQNYCKNHHHFKKIKSVAADNGRSDTIDVVHYNLMLEIIDFNNELINGTATITIISKLDNLESIPLSLESLLVSQCLDTNGTELVFEQLGNELIISLEETLNKGDELILEISYAGSPNSPGSFGGFYFTGDYAFNIGVGIGVDPPTYGRAWFPCLDNFDDKATYNIEVITANDKKAFCSGLLVDQSINEEGYAVWNYEMNDSIPTYLASVAIAPFETISDDYNGTLLEIGVIQNQIDNLNNSFIHLENAFNGFENAFGAYPFDRVGYVIVPFNGGAMEHATNIAYPSFAIQGGTLNYEDLMAHEFAHSWWGDNTTCLTPNEMWLNEGWASFAGSYFFEFTYDKQTYLSKVKENQKNVVKYAHVRDNGYFPVGDVPFDLTYGSTVYDKGADVIHTLRGIMGDENFFTCNTALQSDYAYENITNEIYLDYLSSCSGMDLTNYFEGYIDQKGFVQFSIEQFEVLVTSELIGAKFTVKQRLWEATNYVDNLEIPITFYSLDNEVYTTTITYPGGPCATYEIELPFISTTSILDVESILNDATIDEMIDLDQYESFEFEFADGEVNISASQGGKLHLAHHWVTPDRIEGTVPENIILSPNHYWSITRTNVSDSSFEGEMTFDYNGSLSTNGGYQDHLLPFTNENNLKLLKKAYSNDSWSIVTDAAWDYGASATDKRGIVTFNFLENAAYSFGVFSNEDDPYFTTDSDCINVVSSISQSELEFEEIVEITTSHIRLNDLNIRDLKLHSLDGKLMKETNNGIIEIHNLNTGLYILEIRKGDSFWVQKILLH